MPTTSPPEETGSLLPRAASAGGSSFIARWNVGDWIFSIVIFVLGQWADSWPPVEREIGPQLHDSSIQYPHTTAAQQLVPANLLWRLALYLPLLLIAPIALAPPRGVPSSRLLSELWLGLVSSVASAFLFICIAKVRIGRLRPDFIARCIPEKHGAAVVCTGDPSVVMEGRKSFPSGHSALVFSGLGFASLALLAHLADVETPRAGQLWKGLVGLLPWGLALMVALSRISDYWHHWQDVLVGSLIGHCAAYVAYRLRFPNPFAAGAAGARLLPHVVAGEGLLLKEHRSPPALGVECA